jgi:flotillin
MKALLWLAFCVLLIVSPVLLALQGVKIDAVAQSILVLAGIGGAILGTAIVTLVRLYVRTKANEAFVRTGSGGAKVILDGGAIVVPVLHEVVRVPLETMRLDVDRTGGDALITADKLRADLKAEFYIRVQPNREDVLNAARSLGEKTFNLRSIEELVKDKLISTLRAVAAARTLDELNAKREEFAAETKRAVEADLRHNGLTLETVTVSKLDQTDPQLLNPNNVFDAQGLRRIAEITQAALVERNQIEREAERARAAKDVATRQQILELERQRAEAEAVQRAQVARIQAERDAEAKKAQIEQEQLVATRDVDRQRAVEQAKIEAQQRIIQARREQELTDVDRAKAVETATREMLLAVALADAKKVEAEQKRLAAEAERARQEQLVKTVEVTATAEREGEKELIAAKKAAEQGRYRKQVEADVIAYALQKEAEGKKAAAEAEYQAKIQQAEADAEAARKRSGGETALQMVQVTVARSKVEVEAAQVGVERQRVDVEAQALANRERYGKAALDFELAKQRIEAAKEAQIAIAQALGQFLARSNFNLFGDAASAQKMVESYLRGMGLGRGLDGFLAGIDEGTQQVLGRAGAEVSSVVRAIAERIAGRGGAPAVEEASTAGSPAAPDDGHRASASGDADSTAH